MTYNAIVEDAKDSGFTATILGWPGCTAEGATREEALARLRQVVHDRVAKAEIVSLEIDLPAQTHSWARFAGMNQGDALFDRVVDDIQAYRRDLDAEPEE